MAVKVRVKKSNSGSAKPASKAAKAKASAKPAKREVARGDVDKQRAQVAKLLKQGKKMGEIAEELHVTAGRAKYLQMLNEVEAGDVPSISTSGNDEAIAKRIIAAREKEDDHSSWGWISARSGLPEVRVKKIAEEAGYSVKGSHVAVSRAEARESTTTKKTTKAKAGKTAKSKADPSK